MGVNKFNMKKTTKKSKIDEYGLCLNEYENNFNNAKVYFDRATGKAPEMEVSKAIANILKPKIKKGILKIRCVFKRLPKYPIVVTTMPTKARNASKP